MLCKYVRAGIFSIIFSFPVAADQINFDSLDEVFEQLQKDLAGHAGHFEIVSRLWMVGAPVKSHSNCYMVHHPTTKGLSEDSIRGLYHLFDHLRGESSNVVSLGALVYTKIVKIDVDEAKRSLIQIKVERFEL